MWLIVLIYCRYFVGLGTTSLQNSVLDCVYLFYPFLILLPLTVIHAIVFAVAAASMYPVGPSPGSLYGVVMLGYIPSQPHNHREESCVALLLMCLLWCVDPLD